jgi:hypothetical protein
MAGYPYAYQKAEETAVQTHIQEAMEVDALTSAAGNGGVKHKRAKEEAGVKDSPSKGTKPVEEPPYSPPVPTIALTPEGVEAQAQPAEPPQAVRGPDF